VLLGRLIPGGQSASSRGEAVQRRESGALDLDEVGFEVRVLGEEALEVGPVVEEDRVGVFGLVGALGPGDLGGGGGLRGRRRVGGMVGLVGFGAGD